MWLAYSGRLTGRVVGFSTIHSSCVAGTGCSLALQFLSNRAYACSHSVTHAGRESRCTARPEGGVNPPTGYATLPAVALGGLVEHVPATSLGRSSA